jgi:hypothetical protein
MERSHDGGKRNRGTAKLSRELASHLEILANVHYLLAASLSEPDKLRSLLKLADETLKAITDVVLPHLE